MLYIHCKAVSLFTVNLLMQKSDSENVSIDLQAMKVFINCMQLTKFDSRKEVSSVMYYKIIEQFEINLFTNCDSFVNLELFQRATNLK